MTIGNFTTTFALHVIVPAGEQHCVPVLVIIRQDGLGRHETLDSERAVYAT